jgi:iron complex outermembrane receptor protein
VRVCLRTLLPLLAAALPLLAQPAPQPPSQPKNIGEVTLFGEEQPTIEAATKTEIPISKAPSEVTVITAKQIAESGARTVPDLLRLVAGVNVRWSPMIQAVDIQGFGENPFSSRVLLLIDGAPTNSGDTGGFPLSPGFDYFPIQAIKRIEVVRGPGSSLYGENAFWGVINIVTLSGDDLAGGRAQIFGGGSRSTVDINAQYGAKLKNGSLLASIKGIRSMFPEEFWTDDHSKYQASEVFLKAVLGDWQASVYRHNDHMKGFEEELGTAVGFPPTTEFASAHKLEQTLDILTLKYSHAPTGAAVTYSADLSYAHRNGMHCAGCHAAQEKPQFSQPANHGYQAIGDFRAGLHMIPGHDILVGLEARRLDRADHKQELADDAAAAVSGYDKEALYAQDQFDLKKDVLRAIVGLRYDGKTKIFSSKTSPRVALVYSPNARLVVRGSYSSAFRFPTFSELYQASWFLTVSSDQLPIPPFPLSVFRPNETLKPEEIGTFDLGGEYQLSPSVSLKGNVYRSQVKNFIVVTQHFNVPPIPSTLGWENMPNDARITGGSAEMRANLTNTLTGYVNWTHQTESAVGSGTDSAGVPFQFVYSPKDKVNFGVYGGPFHGYRGAIEMAWKGAYQAPSNWQGIRTGFTNFSEPTFPSYALLNARLSYDIPFRVPFRVGVFGNNLLNKRPEETMVGVVNRLTGREVFGQIEVHF